MYISTKQVQNQHSQLDGGEEGSARPGQSQTSTQSTQRDHLGPTLMPNSRGIFPSWRTRYVNWTRELSPHFGTWVQPHD